MNWWDVAGGLGALVGIGTGVAGLCVGLGANRRAKKANGLAEDANKLAEGSNDIAAQALSKAADANQIAEHANQLSQDANSLSERGFSQQVEDWFVEWVAKWDEEEAVLELRNVGARTAHQVTVIITSDPIHHIADAVGDVAEGSAARLHVPEVVEHRADREAETGREAMALLAFQRAREDPYWRFNAKIVVRWRTGAGFPASVELKKKLR